MAHKIAVSKSGINVLTAKNPNDFIFNSDYNTFKILAEGTLTTQTVNADPTTFTVAHGLGYAPNFYAFCKFPDGKTVMAGPFSENWRGATTTPGTAYGSFTPQSDDTYLYFVLSKSGGNYNVDIKWYIFEVVL